VTKLTNNEELLYGQIHPNLLDGDVPASTNFCPKASDNSELSLDRSSITSAAAAFELFNSNGYSSAAVYALTVSEFGEEQIPCREDGIVATATTKANPAHAIADYSSHTNNQQKKTAKRLKRKAVARGKLHP
jgi:hypothetical protein